MRITALMCYLRSGVEQTLHLVHPSEGGSLHLLVLPVNQDKVDHGGQHGVGVLVLVTLGVGELKR